MPEKAGDCHSADCRGPVAQHPDCGPATPLSLADLPLRHPHGSTAPHAGIEMCPTLSGRRDSALSAAGCCGSVRSQPPQRPAVILELVQIARLIFVHFHKSY